MKKVLAAIAALTLATPAQALTWEEFWEPFNDDHHHHHVHYRGHRHGHRPKRCWGYRTFYYEPDYYGHPGYYKEKLVRVRCRRRYHVHPVF